MVRFSQGDFAIDPIHTSETKIKSTIGWHFGVRFIDLKLWTSLLRKNAETKTRIAFTKRE